MKVALCGATGRAGSRLMQELLSRGHQVLAIVRDKGSLQPREGVAVVGDDLSSAEKTASHLSGSDALLCAYAPPPDKAEELVKVTERLVTAVSRSGVPRLLMVGGAGSLEVAPSLTLLDSGKLPEAWRPLAIAHGHALQVLRSSSIDWTCLSPAIYFEPGERKGRFRLGADSVIFDADGESRISMEDFAIAMVDELEQRRHLRQRFSVGY